MDDKTVSFIKGQLKALVGSTSLEHCKGIAESLISYLDMACPIPVVLNIVSIKMRPNKDSSYLIETIKTIRQVLGVGLLEAKILVENGQVKGLEVSKIVRLYRALEPYAVLDLQGPDSLKLLFSGEP